VLQVLGAEFGAERVAKREREKGRNLPCSIRLQLWGREHPQPYLQPQIYLQQGPCDQIREEAETQSHWLKSAQIQAKFSVDEISSGNGKKRMRSERASGA
jgi:hypothetical protein